MTRNSALTSLVPWMRKLAAKWGSVDDLDAFVGEAMLMAMRRYEDWDPERATLQTFLRRQVLSTYRDHAKRIGCRDLSIHAVTATECVAEWRTDPTAELETEMRREVVRDRERLRKATRELTSRQQVILAARYRGDGRTQDDVAAELQVSKQAVSEVEGAALRRLQAREWRERGERKLKRLRLYLDARDRAEAMTSGASLALFVSAAASSPTVSGGTDVAEPVYSETRVALTVYSDLRAAADARGVSVSHLVRAALRRGAELAHRAESEAS